MSLLIFLFSLATVLGAPTTLDDCKKVRICRKTIFLKFEFSIDLALEGIVKSINVTDRFFRSPEEYRAYADKCEEIMNCAKSVDPAGFPQMKEKMSSCLFYIFYNRDFSSCAHKLIAKKDSGVACLNTLFNDVHEPEVDECVQWDGLQPCVKEQIGSVCNEKTVKEYVEQEKNLRPEFCD